MIFRPRPTRRKLIAAGILIVMVALSPWLLATRFGRGLDRARAAELFQQLQPGMTIPQFQQLIADCDGIHELAHNSGFFVDGEPVNLRRVIWQFHEHFHYLADFDSNGRLHHKSMVEHEVGDWPLWLRRLMRSCGFSVPGDERHWP